MLENSLTHLDGQLAERNAAAKVASSSPLVARILRPCTVPGCVLLTEDGCCESHRLERQREQDARRGKTAARGYDATWRRLRALKLVTDPVCEIRTHCQGMVAGEVDHKIPIRDAPELRLEWSNLQSSCRRCHASKTAREMQARAYKGGG